MATNGLIETMEMKQTNRHVPEQICSSTVKDGDNQSPGGEHLP